MNVRRLLLPAGVGAVFLLATGVLICALAQDQEKLLFEKQSAYSLIRVTEDGRGLRTLWFDETGVRQSVVKPGDPDHLELPYARSMMAGLAVRPDPRRVLIVGLGGGTIPNFLRKHYPQATIDVVDIDPEVVRVAERFFGLRRDEHLRAFVADGRRFVEQVRQPYDMIFLDAYSADSVPYHLTTREFLLSVRRAVEPRQGVVLGNIWSRASNSLYDSMVRTYDEVFDAVRIVDVRGAGNKIIIALPRAAAPERDELAARARELSRRQRFRFNLGELIRYGYRAPAEELIYGRVLRDRQSERRAG